MYCMCCVASYGYVFPGFDAQYLHKIGSIGKIVYIYIHRCIYGDIQRSASYRSLNITNDFFGKFQGSLRWP